MELFKKIGPRIILVEHRGRLVGLVTVKDCLKYQFKVEAQQDGHNAADSGDGNGTGEREQEMPREMALRVGKWVAEKLSALSSGRLKLSSRNAASVSVGNGWPWGTIEEGSHSRIHEDGHGRGILDGTEDVEGGLELEVR